MKHIKSKVIYKGTLVSLCIIILLSMINLPIFAETNGERGKSDYSVSKNENDYANYISKYDGANYGLENVLAAFLREERAGAVLTDCTDSYNNVFKNALKWDSQTGDVYYSANIKESGLYNITLTYILNTNQRNDLAFSLALIIKSFSMKWKGLPSQDTGLMPAKREQMTGVMRLPRNKSQVQKR